MSVPKVPDWFRSAIVYQIYPQSYYDSNGDGIGDLPGICEKLDYVQSLGVNAIWLNPCFMSPFGDAGYDISDFRKVAPRYGTNADLKRLFRKAHRLGIRVLLDFVPGHTSVEHPWFKASCRHERNKYSDWFVWTKSWWDGMGKPSMINGYGERPGSYKSNFFWFQPKLNYGYVAPDPKMPWQMPMDAPACRQVRREMAEIMRFWLDMGADGFRVDSAKLGVGDPRIGMPEILAEWRGMLNRRHPDAVLVAEWGWPIDCLKTGYHGDFLLHNMKAYWSLFTGGDWPERSGKSFFDPDGGDIRPFLEHYLYHYTPTRGRGYICIPTSNHDCRRVAAGRSDDMMELVFAFLMTMPGVPFVYYGEEIGMQFVEGLPSKEGGYPRTGSRTPMQWGRGKNAGFSTAAKSRLYLPVDSRPGRPNVADQQNRGDSLLSRVRRLTALRRQVPTLQADAEFIPVRGEAKPPFVYMRKGGGRKILVALNPIKSGVKASVRVPGVSRRSEIRELLSRGVSMQRADGCVKIEMSPTSFAIVEIL